MPSEKNRRPRKASSAATARRVRHWLRRRQCPELCPPTLSIRTNIPAFSYPFCCYSSMMQSTPFVSLLTGLSALIVTFGCAVDAVALLADLPAARRLVERRRRRRRREHRRSAVFSRSPSLGRKTCRVSRKTRIPTRSSQRWIPRADGETATSSRSIFRFRCSQPTHRRRAKPSLRKRQRLLLWRPRLRFGSSSNADPYECQCRGERRHHVRRLEQ